MSPSAFFSVERAGSFLTRRNPFLRKPRQRSSKKAEKLMQRGRGMSLISRHKKRPSERELIPRMGELSYVTREYASR